MTSGVPSLDRVFVFDIDGVLLDVRERARRAEELSKGDRELFWRYFFSEDLLELDKPRREGIELLLDRAKKGLIAIVTGRPRKLYRATMKQLTEVCGIPREVIWRIEMRDDRDRRKSYLTKLEKILNILYEGYSVEEVHDDDEELLRAVRRYIPSAKLYLHTVNGITQLFRSRLF